MKKFKATKLILSGVALAATAATLSSTTYAWYVSSQTATAEGVAANTASASGSGSVYISKNGTDFFQKVTFESGDFNGASTLTGANAYKKDNKLGTFDPVTTKDGVAFYKDIDLSDLSSATEETGKIVSLSVWLKADKDLTIQPTLLLANTTDEADFEKQTAYQAVSDDITSGSQFFVDAANAMNMMISVDGTNEKFYRVTDVAKAAKTESGFTPYSAVSGSLAESAMLTATVDATYAKDTTVTSENFADKKANLYVLTSGTYNSVAAGTFTAGTDYYVKTADSQSLTGAHLYYKNIMGNAPTNVTTAYTLQTVTGAGTATAALPTINLVANTDVKVTFTFWLEGADISCFDSCTNQSFAFDFDFSLA